MLNKRQKGLLILFTPFLIGFLCGFLVRGSFSKEKRGGESSEEITSSLNDVNLAPSEETSEEISQETNDERPREIIYHRNRLQYANLFADDNDAHIQAAKRLGLSQVPKVRNQVDTRLLTLVEENNNLVVDNLRYSIPYLTKGAEKELNKIAKNFADSLISKGFPKYRIIVSSVLRTEEDVNRLLRSGNPNASVNSAHCYGTTFDITYTRYEAEDESECFMQPFELTKILGEVLLDEKKQKHILVKYERKEHCFHITSLL